MDFTKEYQEAKKLAEDWMAKQFTADVPQKLLYDAMRYSLLAGGKRIRPVLTLKFSQAVGGDMEKTVPVACAVEMLHTYSLIHDDLPCMDDDTLRRGKPTNHVIYGECTATLAGDALQTAAFSAIFSADLPADRLASAGRILAHAAGEDGMCAGQVLDMEGEKRALTLEEIRIVHAGKTAAMIQGACQMGVAAGGGTEADMRYAADYAQAIGLAFQIRDDMLDVTSTPEEMGKSIGKDSAHHKSTFASLLGLEACAAEIDRQTEIACEAAMHFQNSEFFCALAKKLADRSN